VIVCTNQEAKTKIVDVLGTKAQDVVVTTYSQIDKIPEILKL